MPLELGLSSQHLRNATTKPTPADFNSPQDRTCGDTETAEIPDGEPDVAMSRVESADKGHGDDLDPDDGASDDESERWERIAAEDPDQGPEVAR